MTFSFGDQRLPERFWRRFVTVESGCWEFTGATSNGYARLSVDGRQQSAHRVTYERFVGPIPEELVIDHLCRNRACCNPAHLEAVTSAVNILRGTGFSARNARKTHCVKGHEFSPENLVQKKLPQRVCKICAIAKYKAYEARLSQHMDETYAYGY